MKAFEVNRLTIKLSQNEFTDHNDSFGFLRSSSEPFQFMSIESLDLEKIETSKPQPQMKTTIELSDTRYESER